LKVDIKDRIKLQGNLRVGRILGGDNPVLEKVATRKSWENRKSEERKGGLKRGPRGMEKGVKKRQL